MDMRVTEKYLILTTAGWDPALINYHPSIPEASFGKGKNPACSGSLPSCNCCLQMVGETKVEDGTPVRHRHPVHVSGLEGVLLSPSVRWKLGGASLLSPRGKAHLESAGGAAAVGMSRQLQRVQPGSISISRSPLCVNGTTMRRQEMISTTCIRDARSLRLLQRIEIETPSINCIDGCRK